MTVCDSRKVMQSRSGSAAHGKRSSSHVMNVKSKRFGSRRVFFFFFFVVVLWGESDSTTTDLMPFAVRCCSGHPSITTTTTSTVIAIDIIFAYYQSFTKTRNGLIATSPTPPSFRPLSTPTLTTLQTWPAPTRVARRLPPSTQIRTMVTSHPPFLFHHPRSNP